MNTALRINISARSVTNSLNDKFMFFTQGQKIET